MVKKIITKDDIELPALFECVEDYGGYVIVRLTGIDDSTVVSQHDREIDAVKEELDLLNRHIIADFSNVTKIDSSTVAAILLRVKELMEHGRQLFFINASEELEGLVAVHKLSNIIKFYETEKDALRALELLE